jgi:hypothetical protein
MRGGSSQRWRRVSKRCRFCLELVTECVCDDVEGLVQDDGDEEAPPTLEP